MASHRVESLELVPGQCLGPFQLGRSLYQTLPQLRNNQYTPAEVSWAQAVGVLRPLVSRHERRLRTNINGSLLRDPHQNPS